MEDYLKYTIKVMSIGGCWPLPNIYIKEIYKKILLSFVLGLQIMQFIFISWGIYDKFDNIFQVLEGVLEAGLMIQSTMKALTFLIKRQLLRDMVLKMSELQKINLVPNFENKVSTIHNKWMIKAYFWVKIAVTTFTLTTAVFICVPFIQYWISNKRILYFFTILQKDDMEWKPFILLDIYEISVGCGSIVLNLSGETYFSSIVMYMSSRIEILEIGIEQATKEAIETTRTPKLFGECIEYHKKLLAICQMLEEFYSPLLVFQFLVGTISICTTSFLALQISSVTIYKSLSFKFYFVAIMWELFVYCYFGQFLQTKFEKMQIKAVFLEWYNAHLSYQKDMKFFLLNSLKPVTFTAYKVSPVNLESFFAICKASLSYYTILRSFTEDKN